MLVKFGSRNSSLFHNMIMRWLDVWVWSVHSFGFLSLPCQQRHGATAYRVVMSSMPFCLPCKCKAYCVHFGRFVDWQTHLLWMAPSNHLCSCWNIQERSGIPCCTSDLWYGHFSQAGFIWQQIVIQGWINFIDVSWLISFWNYWKNWGYQSFTLPSLKLLYTP